MDQDFLAQDPQIQTQLKSSGLHFVNETKLLYSCGGREADNKKGNDSSSDEDNDWDETLNHESSIKPGKKTRGRVRIKMEFIKDKVRRYTTFSKRKTGIMKKAYELAKLTGTELMLLVASETGHVYTFATKKLKPMIESADAKAWILSCITGDAHKNNAKRAFDFVKKSDEMEDEEVPADATVDAFDGNATAAADDDGGDDGDAHDALGLDGSQNFGSLPFKTETNVKTVDSLSTSAAAAALKHDHSEKTTSNGPATPMDLSRGLHKKANKMVTDHTAPKRACYTQDITSDEHQLLINTQQAVELGISPHSILSRAMQVEIKI